MAFDVKVVFPPALEQRVVRVVDAQLEPLLVELRQTIARVNRLADEYERKVQRAAAVFAEPDPKRE